MTAVHDPPVTNGKPQRIPDTTSPAKTLPTQESEEVSAQRREVEDKRRCVELQRELVHLDDEEAFLQRRSDDDGAPSKDAAAARCIRDREREDWKRQRTSAIRQARLARWRAFLDDWAERTRQRLTDPARAVGTIHRTWTVCAALMIAIITGALLYLTHTVKVGVVGADGSWLGYAIEPIASAMLVISLALQTRAYRQGSKPGGLFVAIDIGLCAASIFLVTVPWGLRFGWGGPDTLVHIIVPVLVAFGVLLWHAGASLTADMLRKAKHDPVLEERVGILRNGIATGELPADPSKSACERHLRQVLGGINREDANKAIRHFLGK